uniref:ATP-binding domain-containing protein n=1 Tax=Pelomonas sp. KK5 TaxID=1855730 RepID=UPI001301D57F
VLGDLCRDAEDGRYDAATAAYAEAVTGQALPAEFLGDGPPLAQQTVMLRESRRFHGPIGHLAQAVNAGNLPRAAELLRQPGDELHVAHPATPQRVVRIAAEGREGAPGGYGLYLREVLARPGDPADFEPWVVRVLQAFERFRVLCAVREGDWGAQGLNIAIERALVAAGLLHKPAPNALWYEGRPVMVTRNDAGIGVFNGDIGIVLRPPGHEGKGEGLRAWFLDGTVPRSVSVSRLAEVETAFAMTVHKSQGSEFEHTLLALPDQGGSVLTRELVYTGITRARQRFTLASGAPHNFAMALAQRTRRASGLLELLSVTPARERFRS